MRNGAKRNGDPTTSPRSASLDDTYLSSPMKRGPRKRSCEEMNPHFFTAPFYFAFIWFRVQGLEFKVQGSGFRVQGLGFRV